MILSFYEFLVFIHIFSAILGMGPGFIMTYIVTKASTMTELRYAFKLRNRLHAFIMVGGILLLVTGVWMGVLNPVLIHQGWYVLSLILFLAALALGPIRLSPSSKPIKRFLKEYQGEEIPDEYYVLAKRLYFWETIENTIF